MSVIFESRKQNTTACACCRHSEYKLSIENYCGFRYECNNPAKHDNTNCPIDEA